MGPAHTPLAGRRAARVAGGERAPPPRPSAGAGPRARRVCATRHLPLNPWCRARSGSSEVWRRRAGPRVRTVAAGARGFRAHLGMAPRLNDWAPKDTLVPCVSVCVWWGSPYPPQGPYAPWGAGEGPHPPRATTPPPSAPAGYFAPGSRVPQTSQRSLPHLGACLPREVGLTLSSPITLGPPGGSQRLSLSLGLRARAGAPDGRGRGRGGCTRPERRVCCRAPGRGAGGEWSAPTRRLCPDERAAFIYFH